MEGPSIPTFLTCPALRPSVPMPPIDLSLDVHRTASSRTGTNYRLPPTGSISLTSPLPSRTLAKGLRYRPAPAATRPPFHTLRELLGQPASAFGQSPTLAEIHLPQLSDRSEAPRRPYLEKWSQQKHAQRDE